MLAANKIEVTLERDAMMLQTLTLEARERRGARNAVAVATVVEELGAREGDAVPVPVPAPVVAVGVAAVEGIEADEVSLAAPAVARGNILVAGEGNKAAMQRVDNAGDAVNRERVRDNVGNALENPELNTA